MKLAANVSCDAFLVTTRQARVSHRAGILFHHIDRAVFGDVTIFLDVRPLGSYHGKDVVHQVLRSKHRR